MKGVILSGGLGTRLRPLSHTGAKQIIPIANKPVLEYCIEDLVEAGISEIAMIVGYTPERIQSIIDKIGYGEKWNIKITYIEQDAPRGIAHGIYCAKDFVGNDNFVVYLGDNLTNGFIAQEIRDFEKYQYDMGLFLCEVDDPTPYGVAVFNSNNEIIGIQEKPKNPPSNYVVTGIYYFSQRVFQIIENLKPSDRGELEISDTIQNIFDSNSYKYGSVIIDGWWDDTGTSEAILNANHLILSELKPVQFGIVENNVEIMGKVSIGKGTIIKSGSKLRGPIIIGENCKIGPSYIGPYTSIGDNTTLTGGEIESSIIIGDSTINLELDKRIEDSLIGKNTQILSKCKRLPSAYKLVLGEHSEVYI